MNSVVDNKIDNQIDDKSVDNQEFVPLIVDDEYEISTTYPYIIRRKSNGFIPKEFIDKSSGYVRIVFNNKKNRKHRLIAIKFLQNTNNLPEVNHKNNDRSDYHLSNLMWMSRSDTLQNRTLYRGIQYEYVDTIPDDAIVVNEYGTRTAQHRFENYYFHDNTFYFYNGIQYRKLHVNEMKRDRAKFVCLTNTNGKVINVYYHKFRKLYHLE